MNVLVHKIFVDIKFDYKRLKSPVAYSPVGSQTTIKYSGNINAWESSCSVFILLTYLKIYLKHIL